MSATGLQLDSGGTIPFENNAQKTAAQWLLSRGAEYVSIGRLVQVVSQELQSSRTAIEPSIRALLRTLGSDYVERRVSKGSKVLVRIRPTARGVVQYH